MRTIANLPDRPEYPQLERQDASTYRSSKRESKYCYDIINRQEVNIDSKDMDGVTPSRLAFYGKNTHICGLIELEKTIRVKAARERINGFQDALKDKNLDDVKRHMFDPCSSWAQLVTADEGEIQCAPNIYIRHICGALGDKFVRIIEVGNEYKVVKNKVATKSES
jgi:hypothetical protein